MVISARATQDYTFRNVIRFLLISMNRRYLSKSRVVPSSRLAVLSRQLVCL